MSKPKFKEIDFSEKLSTEAQLAITFLQIMVDMQKHGFKINEILDGMLSAFLHAVCNLGREPETLGALPLISERLEKSLHERYHTDADARH